MVAINGKTLRRTGDRAAGVGPLHPVSAWATANGLALGRLAVGAKSNEVTAIPELIGLVEFEGCVVTIDAMGCRRHVPGFHF